MDATVLKVMSGDWLLRFSNVFDSVDVGFLILELRFQNSFVEDLPWIVEDSTKVPP